MAKKKDDKTKPEVEDVKAEVTAEESTEIENENEEKVSEVENKEVLEKETKKTEEPTDQNDEITKESEPQDQNTEDEKKAKDDKSSPAKKKLLKKPTKKKSKKEDAKEIVEADEDKDGYVSAREVVNTLDDDIKVVERSEDEVIADKVADQLKEKQDYFIIRIRKSVFLMLLGILVLLMWLVPVSRFLESNYDVNVNPLSYFNKKEEVIPSPTPTPIVESAENTLRARIKVASSSDETSSMSALLKSGGFSQVDIVETEVEEPGYSVVVKKGDSTTRSKVVELLADYNIGSSSSELTNDSDFSAVILIGK